MKQKTITIGSNTVCFVEVPEDGYGFEIKRAYGKPYFFYWCDRDTPNRTDLPSMGWRILGSSKASDCSEEDWKEVVDYVIKSYTGFTATKSGHSLLSLHGFKPLTTIVLIKNKEK